MVYDLQSGRAKRGASGALNLQSALAGLDSLIEADLSSPLCAHGRC